MTLVALILIQAIWTSSYVAMKVALATMPVGLILILRYGIASLCFFLFGAFKGTPRLRKRTWLLILFVGIANFSLSPYCHLRALEMTQVIDVSVLVSTEPLLTAFMAALLLRERLSWDLIFVFILSALGVLILSGVTWEGLAASPLTAARLTGNLLFALALCFEAVFSTAGRHLTQRYNPLTVVAWMHFFGFLTNLSVNFPTLSQIPLSRSALPSWIGVFFLGIFCSAIGYGGWYLLVKRIPVSRLALSLFLQPVIGIFLGYLLMKEELSRQGILGAGLIVITLFVWVATHLRRQAKEPPVS